MEYDFSCEIDTIDHIIDHLYLGSCKSALDVVKNREDIGYILNLSQYTLFAPGKNVMSLNIDDCPDFPIELSFDKAHKFINEAKHNNSGILVHCRAGVSRSPTIVISYLMKYHNMSFENAYKHVLTKRKIAPNHGFVEKLKRFNVV
jgi:protein tyrosine phosphatase